MRCIISLLALFGTLITVTIAQATEEAVKFAAKPTATRTGGKVTINFSASAPTDVAVYILDGQGKCVRHLAAGVIGKKGTPPEPLKAGLAQALEWDGLDDAGKPATGGGFKARVRLGLKPEFDSLLLHNPDGCGFIMALAAGPNSTLYAFHRDDADNVNSGGVKLKVYTHEGKHFKTLIPFPADIAPEKVKAIGVFQTPEGDILPRVHNYEQLSFYPDTILDRNRSLAEYSSPAVDSKGRVYWIIKGPMLLSVTADGGIPYDTYLGPKLTVGSSDRPCLAVSSDDKYVYLADGTQGCVFRVDAEKRTTAEPFVGKNGKSDKETLVSPHGLAVAKGLLYVADSKGDRVVVFKESDRSYVGEIKVKAPDTIGVDPATEAVYVCSATKSTKQPDLVKFDGYKNGKEICRLALPFNQYANADPWHRIVVDASAKPVRIWMTPWKYSAQKLYCYEDAGDKFTDKGDPRSKDQWAEGPRDLSVDRERNELYVKGNVQKYYRFDEPTAKFKDLLDLGKLQNSLNSLDRGTQLVPGPDGNLYTDSWGVGLMRFDHQGKPLNWQGQSTHSIPLGGIMLFQERGMALRPYAAPDEIFRVANPQLEANSNKPAKPDDSRSSVNVLGPDGKVKRTVIWQCTLGAVVRLDAKGNIYMAEAIKAPNRVYPEFFDDKVEKAPKSLGINGWPFWMSYVYGSIVKFPPEGGVIWYKKTLPNTIVGQPPAELLAKPKIMASSHYMSDAYMPVELQGALWYRFGYAPFSFYYNWGGSACCCEGSGFDVDPFGRVFYPNMGQERIEVIDTNNNWINCFGKYGNEDSGGKDARVKKPGIPLAWPSYVAVSDNYAYVADTVNRQVVRVKLGAVAEETCELK